MRTKQTILFILAIVFTIGFFMPLLTMKAHIPMSTIFGDGVQEDFNLTMSAFNLLTDNNKVRFNSIFIISLIIVPILITIIAITQKYKWLFTVSLPLLLFIFSMIYSIKTNVVDDELLNSTIEGMNTTVAFDIGWAFFIIPTLIMLVMGLIELFKKNQ
jgi:hypothetical protein